MIRIDAANLIFTVINLLVLVVAMRIFLFKPVQNIIAKRQEEADKLNLDMNVIDSGIAVQNMHAPYEVISKVDLYETLKGYEAFLNM